MDYHNFPKKLRELPQWILWKKELVKDRTTKVPYATSGKKAASTRANEWDTIDNCIKQKGYDGIGFVFVKGIVGIDLDNCLNQDGSLKDWVKPILNTLDSYTEYSPSKTGLHIIVESDADFTKNDPTINTGEKVYVYSEKEKDAIEFYNKGRYFTVTGDVFDGRKELKTINEDTMLAWHKKEVISRRKSNKNVPIVIPTSSILPDDNTILSRIRRSKNGAKFQTLYDLGTYESLGFGSQSEADLALTSSLMFWCCNDMTTVDRLFRGSKLYRAKWDEKHGVHTYGVMTMETARRSEVMKWNDPHAEDKKDLLATIGYKGNVTIEKIDDDYRAATHVPSGKVTFEFSEVINTNQSIDVVMIVNVIKDNEEQTPFRYNIDIKSQSQQEKLATSLNKAYGTVKEGFNWTLIINRVFNALTTRLNSENIIVSLKGILPEEPEFLVYPFLQKDTTTIFYGYGDTGKTWLAIYFCIKMALGLDFFGYKTREKTKILFIDYEDTRSTFTSRIHKLCIGMGIEYESVTDNIYYQKFTGSIKDTFSLIKKQITEHSIDLIVLDSGGQASGGSPNDETKVIQLFGYLEHLPCTKLILHHEPKNTMGIDDNKAFYGTSYWHSSSRAMFRLAVESKDSNEKVLKLSKAKGNNFGDIDPIYYKLAFTSTERAQLAGKPWGYVEMKPIEKEAIKHNIDREESIIRAIGSEGASFSQIKELANIPKGSIQYELKKLEENGKIRLKKEGRKVTYFLTNYLTTEF